MRLLITIQFLKPSRTIKYPDINVTKQVKDFYNENFKSLKEDIERDIRKRKDIPCLYISRINVVKMNILETAIYRVNGKAIDTSHSILHNNRKKILKFIWNQKRFWRDKEILNKKKDI